MIQIHDILGLVYRRRMSTSREPDRTKDAKINPARKEESASKVYVKLLANLVNPEACDYSARTA